MICIYPKKLINSKNIKLHGLLNLKKTEYNKNLIVIYLDCSMYNIIIIPLVFDLLYVVYSID
jgi:hypothetical protein